MQASSPCLTSPNSSGIKIGTHIPNNPSIPFLLKSCQLIQTQTILSLSYIKDFFGPQTKAFVRRDVSSNTQPNILASFQKNMDQFKNCLDQSLASAVGDVNENQLKPVFTVLGDSINRFSKAVTTSMYLVNKICCTTSVGSQLSMLFF